jgi:serine/threonine protein kinase
MGIVHRDLKPENVMIVSPMPGEKQRMEAAEIRALDVIMQRCLAKDNGDRYGSAAELANDLVPALARCGDFGGADDLMPPDAPIT